MWPMLASMGIQALGAAGSANAGNAQLARQYANQLRETTAQNKAINEANITNVLRTGYMMGIQNLQTSRMKMRAAEAGFKISMQGSEALGANVAEAAAAGAVGASVDAAADLIRKKAAEAQIDEDRTFQEELLNHNLAVEQIAMSGSDAQRKSVKVDNKKPNYADPTRAVLGSLVGSAISAYAQGSISLGGLSPGNAAGGIKPTGGSGLGLKLPTSFKL